MLNAVECRYCDGIGICEDGERCGYCLGDGFVPETKDPNDQGELDELASLARPDRQEVNNG
jgi:hypothetical protein